MAEKDIQLKQVLKRFPPGDRWTPADADQPVFSNLTEGIEWVFQSTQERDYVIKAAEGKVFIYHENEIADYQVIVFLGYQVFRPLAQQRVVVLCDIERITREKIQSQSKIKFEVSQCGTFPGDCFKLQAQLAHLIAMRLFARF